MTRSSFRAVALPLAVLAQAALLACKPVEPLVPVGLAVVQGNHQVAQAGSELPAQVVIRLVDIDGAPVPDFPVGFVVLHGGGTVTPSASPTDEFGEVKVKWTLGPNLADQVLVASAGTLAPAQIFASGLLPSDIVVAQGVGQSAKASAALPNPIVVRVVGPGNVPLKGIAVAFQVASGGGLITPQSGVTNASGEVQSRWTLGPTIGTQLVHVVVGSLAPMVISAMAN
jgi:hypothetical protein